MFHRREAERRNLWWVLALVSLPFGLVYCFLLCLLRQSLQAEASEWLNTYVSISQWGGPTTLFALNAGILGWVCAAVASKRLGEIGTFVLLPVLLWGVLATAGGFFLSTIFVQSAPGVFWKLISLCVLVMAASAGIRACLDETL